MEELKYPLRSTDEQAPPVSIQLSDMEIGEIKYCLLYSNWSQAHLAGKYGVNSGRISEINTGKRHSHIRPVYTSLAERCPY